MAPLREIGPTLADSLREMPYAESHTIHSDPDFPHACYGDSAMLSDLDPGRAREVVRLTGPDAPAMSVVQINHLGGAMLVTEVQGAGGVLHSQPPLGETAGTP